MRRWQVAGLAVLGVFALACEGTGAATPAPTTTGPLPNSIGAMGDSITAGFGSCNTLLACGRNSWSTGTTSAVDSHYSRILAGNSGMRGHEHNYAVPGARASALQPQARAAVRDKVQYVTLLIGANDACTRTVDAMTDPAQFRSALDDALGIIKKGLPKTRVFIASIPDLYRLWDVGHTNSSAVRAWGFGICPSLLAKPTSTADADDKRRRQVRSRIDAYNDALAAACKAYGKKCRFDGGAAHSVRFTLDLVNHLDYFHPNAAGQRKLADVTYPGRFTW